MDGLTSASPDYVYAVTDNYQKETKFHQRLTPKDPKKDK